MLVSNLRTLAVLAVLVTAVGPAYAQCDGDVDRNGVIDVNDLNDVILEWGPCPGCAADVNGDDQVGVDDLVQVIVGWGPCGFPYPQDQEYELAKRIGLQFLVGPSQLTLPQETYERIVSDIEAIEAAVPEIAPLPHYHHGNWVPYNLLVGVIDTMQPLTALEEHLAYYDGAIIDDYFGGSILVLDFPQGVNVPAMVDIVAGLDNIEYAEPDGYFGGGPFVPTWHPTPVGGGALLWTISVNWCSGELCDGGNQIMDCYTVYEILTEVDSTVTVLSVESTPWQNGPCPDLP